MQTSAGKGFRAHAQTAYNSSSAQKSTNSHTHASAGGCGSAVALLHILLTSAGRFLTASKQTGRAVCLDEDAARFHTGTDAEVNHMRPKETQQSSKNQWITNGLNKLTNETGLKKKNSAWIKTTEFVDSILLPVLQVSKIIVTLAQTRVWGL